jgi:hypothetical protein
MPTAAAKPLLPLPSEIRTAQDFWLGLQLALRGDFVVCPVEAAAIAQDAGGLSRRKALVFGDTCRLLALARPQLSGTEARFALARNAARAARFFRREAPGRLTWAERWGLRRAAWLPSVAPPPAFLRLAALYDRAESPL